MATFGHPSGGEGKPERMLIVILNFNGIDDTLACLDSLRGQTCQDFAVQVIDNGSLAATRSCREPRPFEDPRYQDVVPT
jgi:GT2 family glycosyltransferase